ncbi:MAG: serine/threonine-protein phosphatase [Opitutaceae bacterium]|nr:serine/threonine-protein phosphatase [Opitutaceae bacterium]
MIKFRSAALTDIGRVRSENEDRYLHVPEKCYFGVADGVGGLPGGAEAAQATLDHIVAGLDAHGADSLPDLIEVVHQANEAVLQLGHRINPEMGIGSTLTFGVIQGDHLHLAHVGDSRAYLVRNGETRALTNDHSVENEARMRRARGEKIYFHEINRNALTRCMGQPTPPEVDLATEALRPGDHLLFCTDGITRLVSEKELASIVVNFDQPEAALRDMIALAIRRGGPDNATGVLVTIDAVE